VFPPAISVVSHRYPAESGRARRVKFRLMLWVCPSPQKVNSRESERVVTDMPARNPTCKNRFSVSRALIRVLLHRTVLQ